MKVIDVSMNNGDIDWIKVKESGVYGVIIRAGRGNTASRKDNMFESNYKGAAEAGLHIGAYWYSYAVSAEEAAQEANAFLECIKGKKFDLPVYLDIEDKTQLGLGKTVCTEIVTTFCEVMVKAKYFVGVYSFDSFFSTNLEDHIQTKYSCWVARVDGNPPQYCTTYDMWQYTWKGNVNGICGNVDMDECYKDFPPMIINVGLNGYDKPDT